MTSDPNATRSSRNEAAVKSSRYGRWLLLLPLIAVVFPSLYNFWEPTFFGIPFFYWYQFLWVFLTAGITYYLFRLEEANAP